MKLLFVCTGNSCRSPMAEAVANDIAEKKGVDISAESCGLAAEYSSYASKNAIAAMQEMGLDINAHRTRMLRANFIDDADYVICMGEEHRDYIMLNYPDSAEKTYTLKEAIGEEGDIADPYGGDIEVYRRCAGELYRTVSLLIDALSPDKDAGQ